MSNQNMCEVCDTRGATVYYDEGHYCQSCYNEYQMFDGLTYQELKQARDYFMTRPSLKWLTNPKTGQKVSHDVFMDLINNALENRLALEDEGSITNAN
tara:strand:- start:167 stop:460 length:294 start_codon:yes stop_codon:yes gene_type:complete